MTRRWRYCRRQLMDDVLARNQLIRLSVWLGLPYGGARLLEVAVAKVLLVQAHLNKKQHSQVLKLALELQWVDN